MIHVKQYIIDNHNGNKAEFARSQGVHRSHVSYWCKGDYYMHDGKLYHFTRDIK